MTDEVALGELLAASVRVDGWSVGTVVGVVLDPDFERLLGFEVATGTADRVFLPWVAARLEGHAVAATSALVLVDLGGLDTYARLGARIVRDESELAALTITSEGTLSSAAQEPAAVGRTGA